MSKRPLAFFFLNPIFVSDWFVVLDNPIAQAIYRATND